MVPGVEGSSPFTHPTKRNEGSGVSRSLIPFHTGVSPSGKARDFDSLIRWFESSHPCHAFPDGPILFHTCHAPLAQSVEHLPFKQGVRGSNPRWSTKKSPRLLAGRFFSGCSQGVEVYPRQGKSPLEHQKISSPFGGEIFSGCYTALSPLSGSART